MIKKSLQPVHIIGGGRAGSEAAWQLAESNIPVILHEMRPVRRTDAHQSDKLAELVCSNSFRSDDANFNAVGFPKVFYITYHGYAKYFTNFAISRYRNLKKGNKSNRILGL